MTHNLIASHTLLTPGTRKRLPQPGFVQVGFEDIVDGNRRRSRVLFRSGSAAANCMAGALIDACGLATLTPQEETESPGEARSRRRLCLLSVDE
jgi:hypothetical protein